ncbi:hypothetical protein CKAH01_16704 [Colletotrichum kahawae]|uniref:Uncharacterized protein n=1 Tax=Colletotrichum kahawae TaxID=34407 RepID=A0AAD9YEG6_COLKA|nr:hypothetical protein CKAH01_16704 [Colletotrichum kahawae]
MLSSGAQTTSYKNTRAAPAPILSWSHFVGHGHGAGDVSAECSTVRNVQNAVEGLGGVSGLDLLHKIRL